MSRQASGTDERSAGCEVSARHRRFPDEEWETTPPPIPVPDETGPRLRTRAGQPDPRLPHERGFQRGVTSSAH